MEGEKYVREKDHGRGAPYLIDEEGTIVKAFGKVKAADNPAQMLAEL